MVSGGAQPHPSPIVLGDNGGDGCWKERSPHLPLSSLVICFVITVEAFRFLVAIISQDIKWGLDISSITRKAQQRTYFLRQLKRFNLLKTRMVHGHH